MKGVHGSNRDQKIDKILTSKKFGIPIMILFLGIIFWLTITGANYPSNLLSDFFNMVQEKLLLLFHTLHAPDWLTLKKMKPMCSINNIGHMIFLPTNSS